MGSIWNTHKNALKLTVITMLQQLTIYFWKNIF